MDILDSGGDDGEMKRNFLLKNAGWISHGAVLKVLLWV